MTVPQFRCVRSVELLIILRVKFCDSVSVLVAPHRTNANLGLNSSTRRHNAVVTREIKLFQPSSTSV